MIDKVEGSAPETKEEPFGPGWWEKVEREQKERAYKERQVIKELISELPAVWQQFKVEEIIRYRYDIYFLKAD